MGKITISMVIFHSYVTNYQKVNKPSWIDVAGSPKKYAVNGFLSSGGVPIGKITNRLLNKLVTTVFSTITHQGYQITFPTYPQIAVDTRPYEDLIKWCYPQIIRSLDHFSIETAMVFRGDPFFRHHFN